MKFEKIILDGEGERVYLEAYMPDILGHYTREPILIIPGGGYEAVCSDREGEPIAFEFMQKGMCPFVLHYSVGSEAVFPRPLIQAAKAIKYIKDNAEKYGIDKDRLFVTGFSAGGHLCAATGTMWHIKEIYDAVDMPFGYNKPKGIIPVYPVISDEVPTHKGSFDNLLGTKEPTATEKAKYSLEHWVDERSAPAFIVHSSDDSAVPVYNSLVLAKAYADMGQSFELHIFKSAAHGMALARDITGMGNPAWINEDAAKWPELARGWMKGIK